MYTLDELAAKDQRDLAHIEHLCEIKAIRATVREVKRDLSKDDPFYVDRLLDCVSDWGAKAPLVNWLKTRQLAVIPPRFNPRNLQIVVTKEEWERYKRENSSSPGVTGEAVTAGESPAEQAPGNISPAPFNLYESNHEDLAEHGAKFIGKGKGLDPLSKLVYEIQEKSYESNQSFLTNNQLATYLNKNKEKPDIKQVVIAVTQKEIKVTFQDKPVRFSSLQNRQTSIRAKIKEEYRTKPKVKT